MKKLITLSLVAVLSLFAISPMVGCGGDEKKDKDKAGDTKDKKDKADDKKDDAKKDS